MKRWLALALLLIPSWCLAAPPTLTLPKEIEGEPGTFIAIRAETDAAWVNFKAGPGLAVFQPNLLSDKKATVVTAIKAGRYKVSAYTGNAEGGVDVEVTVVVGGVPVPPPVDPPPVDPPPIVVDKSTAAVYIYEKDLHAVPSAVSAALDKLNRVHKVLATLFEQDTKDGTGDTPEQYKVPLAAAREAGLPAFVVTGGGKVLKVVKDPKTEQQVIEAVIPPARKAVVPRPAAQPAESSRKRFWQRRAA